MSITTDDRPTLAGPHRRARPRPHGLVDPAGGSRDLDAMLDEAREAERAGAVTVVVPAAEAGAPRARHWPATAQALAVLLATTRVRVVVPIRARAGTSRPSPGSRRARRGSRATASSCRCAAPVRRRSPGRCESGGRARSLVGDQDRPRRLTRTTPPARPTRPRGGPAPQGQWLKLEAMLLHLGHEQSVDASIVEDTMTETAAPTLTLAGDYQIDPAHSRIGFTARHAMVTKVRGSFGEFRGTAHIDDTDPAASSTEIVIARAASTPASRSVTATSAATTSSPSRSTPRSPSGRRRSRRRATTSGASPAT